MHKALAALLMGAVAWSAGVVEIRAETVPLPQAAPKAQARPGAPGNVRGAATAQNQLPIPINPSSRAAATTPPARPGAFDAAGR